MRTVAMYLGVRKETGGLYQYARTLLHALASTADGDLHLVAISPAGTDWETVCAAFGVEWREIGAPTFLERAAGKVVRTLGGGGAGARRLMSRLTPLGRSLAEVDASLCIYAEYEHYSFELATPSLIPIHDLMHRYESRFSENRAFTNADEFFAKICNGARGVLVDSEVGKQQLSESYGPFSAEVFVLPYIPPDYVYDESLLAPDPTIPELLAGLPERFLFYPAQFWEHKNHNRLIEAVVRAAERYPDIHLALAGSPKNHYEAVQECVKALHAENRVTFLGFVSDAAKLALYRQAVALVMPSFYGPTNIPQLEAFELGCPVAVSRIYGIPEQVGDAALLFDPESVDEIQECIERLWGDEGLRADLIRRGHERATQWGPAEFVSRARAIVDSILKSRR